MIIKVTREHIEKAAPLVSNSLKNLKQKILNPIPICQFCPVALALKEVFKVNYVSVDAYQLSVGLFPEDGTIFQVYTPEKAASWINHYDDESEEAILASFKPFEFELDLSEVRL